jgi:L-fuculose-phosphate aldolase
MSLEINWRDKDARIAIGAADADEFLLYAHRLVARGLVSSTLGNIAVRGAHPQDEKKSIIYTKCRGVSLEEMSRDHLVVTSIETNDLLSGSTPPSIGHQMNRAIMKLRPDINAVIHTHPDAVIGYFSQSPADEMKMISVDTALVLGAPPRILPSNVNLETDSSQVAEFVAATNCLVMPNHGLTTFGRTLSQAYHRHTAFVAEVQRLIWAELLARIRGNPVRFVEDTETAQLYSLGEQVIYGRT